MASTAKSIIPMKYSQQKPESPYHVMTKKLELYTLVAKQPGSFRVMTKKLGHAFEVWPIFGLVGFWAVICSVTVYHSFRKIEVWADRSKKTPPWDWSRVRDNYYKLPTLLYDPEGKTHRRLEIMEKLQDQLLEASKKRQEERKKAALA